MFASHRIGTVLTLGSVAMLATSRLAAAQPFPGDEQDHPGRSWRVQKTATGAWGDTRVVESIAGHVVIYALHRYGLDQVIRDPAQIARARKEMYDFLSWKYGNPSLVTAQWISAGYRHFDGHVAEAAMALLGTELEGPAKVVRLPKELSSYLKSEVEKMASSDTAGVCAKMRSDGGNGAASGGDGGGAPADSAATGETLYGLACRALVRLAAEAAKLAVDRIGISSAALGGANRVNWRDADVTLALFARNAPQPANAARTIQAGRLQPSRMKKP